MSDDRHDSAPDTGRPGSRERSERPSGYEPPRVTDLGSVEELTRGALGTGTDLLSTQST